MAILSGSKILILFGFGSGFLLAATGHIGFTAKMSLAQALLNLTLSIAFVMVFDWGLPGVAAGTLIARLLTHTFIVPPYACRKAGINWWLYVKAIWCRGLLVAGLFTILCYGIQGVLPARNWFDFFIQVCLATLCYAPVALLILLPTDERVRLQNKSLSILLGSTNK